MCARDDCPFRNKPTAKKNCGCCGSELSFSSFALRTASRDLHQHWCRWCMSNYNKYVYPNLLHKACITGKKVFATYENAKRAFPHVKQDMTDMIIEHCGPCTGWHIINKHHFKYDWAAHRENRLKEYLAIQERVTSDDRQWFAVHPDATHYYRAFEDGELGSLRTTGKMKVVQHRPGYRTREPQGQQWLIVGPGEPEMTDEQIGAETKAWVDEVRRLQAENEDACDESGEDVPMSMEEIVATLEHHPCSAGPYYKPMGPNATILCCEGCNEELLILGVGIEKLKS